MAIITPKILQSKLGFFTGSAIAACICLFTLTSLMPLKKAVEVNNYKVKTVVIDAGHGGKDPGCHGASNNEKAITLKVALQLGKMIKTYMKDVKVIYTRESDKFIELNERAGIANRNKADVFISIHCNSVGTKTIKGSETYVMGPHKNESNLEVAKRENSVILQEKNYLEKYDGFDPNSPLQHIFFANLQSVHQARSLQLAESIEKQFVKKKGRNSRGVKQAGFLVLWRTAMPSVLIEIGYLTNKTDEKYIGSENGQEFIAKSIYKAFRDYKLEMEE
jgi:N-acetylmuramoyl-L-alanine amidase